MIDIKKKIQAARDYASKSYRVIRKVPQIGRGRILAYSRDCGYRNLYNLYDMMYKTDCGTYQEMWEENVKTFHLSDWIFVDELFDLIIRR